MAKIAILMSSLACGGAERVNFELARRFADFGHQVELLVRIEGGEFWEEASREFPIINLGHSRVYKLPSDLAAYLKKSRPDALLASMWPISAIAPIGRIWSRVQCKVIVSEHGTLSFLTRNFGRIERLILRATMAIGYRLADHRVGVSQGVVDSMAELALMKSASFSVIHNPVAPCADIAQSEIDHVESLWGQAEGSRLISVGRLASEKNHALLLQAFAKLLPGQAARLMIVGAGPEERRLKELSLQLGISGNVIFAGFQREVDAIYQSADLFVLPSDSEGLPTVLIESLRNGLPVVATDSGSGVHEILGTNHGRIVPKGDVSKLAQAMEGALNETPEKEILKSRAREFAPEIAAQEYLARLV